MRDNIWLEEKLEYIWKNYFNSVEKINPVIIRFGRKARRRFGSIKLENPRRLFYKKITAKDKSIITINGYFKNNIIPDYVIDLTIAHELVHYAHGFNSAHTRNFKYPHQGKIVERELIDRELGSMLKLQENWVKRNWFNFLKKEARNGR